METPSERNMMIRKIALGTATALLVVGLPVAALGISRSGLTDTPNLTQEQTVAATPSTDIAATADQTQVRQQLRVHAETGVPEGLIPTQTRQRIHNTQDQAGTQARSQGHGHGGGGQGTQPGDGTGAQFGRNGGGGHGSNGTDTPGECTNPDGPIGTGPNGTTG